MPNPPSNKRCARCGSDLPAPQATCSRCGLVDAGPQPAAEPGAASPAGPPGPAPWQAPPQAAEGTWPPTNPPTNASAARAEPGQQAGWRPGQQNIPAEPPPPRVEYSRTLGRVVLILLVIESVVAFAYGVLAATERRGIFAALASDGASVTHDEAVRSDRINAVLFVTGGLVTGVTIVFVVIWLLHVRRAVGKPPLLVPMVALAGVATVAITTALALHATTDFDRITLGYLILAGGAFAVTAACVVGIVAVRRVTARATAQQAEAAEEPVPSWKAAPPK